MDQQREDEHFTQKNKVSVREKEAEERERKWEDRFYTKFSGDSALTKKISF